MNRRIDNDALNPERIQKAVERDMDMFRRHGLRIDDGMPIAAAGVIALAVAFGMFLMWVVML